LKNWIDIMRRWLFYICLFCAFTAVSQHKKTYTYAVKRNDTLRLDVYTPNFIKPADSLPVLLWMHGGGFSGGSRDNTDEQKLCEYVAEQGFIGISISYRLRRKGKESGFGCNCEKNEKLATFKNAIKDYLDAVLFVYQNKNKLQVNSNKIIAGGSSAGAEAVLNAVFMKEYFIKDLTPYKNIEFAGVFSLAGAMVNANYITERNAIPAVLFHGTDDDLVPYGSAPHHYCKPIDPGFLVLDGSATIVNKLHELEVPFYFYSVKGGKHELSGIPFYELENIVRFFNRSMLANDIIQTKKIITSKP